MIRLPKQREFWIHVPKELIPTGWIGTPGLELTLNQRKFTVTADPQTLLKIRGNAQDTGNAEYAIIASDSPEEVELQPSINAAYLKAMCAPGQVPEAVINICAKLPPLMIQAMGDECADDIRKTASALADAYPFLEQWGANVMEMDLETPGEVVAGLINLDGIFGGDLHIIGRCASSEELKKRFGTVINFSKFISRPQQFTGPAHGEQARRYPRLEGWGQATIAGGSHAMGSSLKLEEVSANETRNLMQRFGGGKISNITSDENILVVRLADKCKREQGTGQGEIRALLVGLQANIKEVYGYQLSCLLLAAILVGNLGDDQIKLISEAAGASRFHPMQQLEHVGCVLAGVSKCTGIPGYERADKLMEICMKEIAPLRQGDVNPENFHRIFVERMTLFGNELYLAIHAKTALPDILELPQGIKTKLKALQVATEALEQMRQVQDAEAEQRARGTKRQAEQDEAEQRRNKPIGQDLSQTTEQRCNSFLLSGKCTKTNCSYKHVKGTSGVDKCPFGADCRRKEFCLLAWSH